jgi:hypothetical protein
MQNFELGKSNERDLIENIDDKHEIIKYKIKEQLTESIKKTTVHGIHDILNVKDNFLRTFLIVCFLASAGFCCYLTITTFIAYFSYDVLIASNVNSDVPVECNFYLKKYIFNLFFSNIAKVYDFLQFRWLLFVI